jgi:SsrA-binding protein
MQKEPSIQNRQARHDYEILETLEAGMVLTGTEVKSVRQGQASLKECHALARKGEVFVYGMHISPYDHGNRYNQESVRPRKLLLHKAEIRRLAAKTEEKGLALVPLSLYFKKGKVKLQLAVARGKKLYDRRQDIKKREVERELRAVNKKAHQS